MTLAPPVLEDGILTTPGLRPPEPARFAPAEPFTISAPAAVQPNPEPMLPVHRIAGALDVISDTAAPGILIAPQRDSTCGMGITIFSVPAAMLLTAASGAVCTVTSVP